MHYLLNFVRLPVIKYQFKKIYTPNFKNSFKIQFTQDF